MTFKKKTPEEQKFLTPLELVGIGSTEEGKVVVQVTLNQFGNIVETRIGEPNLKAIVMEKARVLLGKALLKC